MGKCAQFLLLSSIYIIMVEEISLINEFDDEKAGRIKIVFMEEFTQLIPHWFKLILAQRQSFRNFKGFVKSMQRIK